MGTFLTTSRMDPALVARIEASVRGRHKKPGSPSLAPRVVALVRVGLVLALALGIYTVVSGRRRDRQELERARTTLLDAVRGQGASLAADDRNAVERAETWMMRSAGDYEGELVADELRAPGALAAALARPTLYIRGAKGAFGTSRRIAEAAGTSAKDALLLCLVEPPASRVEKVLLEKVRVAYAGGIPMEDRTANVRRLQDAIVGLPLLMPPWTERVKNAEDGAELARLKRELDHAPIERAKQAARAGLLLMAIDEPGDGGGPTELDGERAHPVRIELVDLAAAKVLLRTRKLVDPTWISLAKKSDYAAGLDSCGLAFDVHEGVRAAPAPRKP